MRALLLNGAREDGETVDRAAHLLTDLLAERGWDAHTMVLREEQIRGCMGCFACWVKTPGECIIDDAGREVARRTVQSNMVAWLSPVTFGGCSSQLKRAIDRTIPTVSPLFEAHAGEIHHRKRYQSTPALAAVGASPDPAGAEAATFRGLHERNALNMRPPSHGVCVLHEDSDDPAIRQALTGLLEEVLV
jgi:multimeric flavodoxin WrbA